MEIFEAWHVGITTHLYQLIPNHTRGQMSSAQKSKSSQVATRLAPIESQRIDELVAGGLYRSSADFAREAIREKLRSMEPAGIKDVAPTTAQKMIIDFLRNHPGQHFASEIADELGLDYGTTFRTINRLLQSQKIKKARV